jgi:uncharacterized membrane protein YsdA (DUF1294 family)
MANARARKEGEVDDSNGRLDPLDVIVFIALLLLPAMTLRRLAHLVDYRWILVAAGAMSFFTFLLYLADKERARDNEWRIPESTLHLFGFLGGWPGAYLAQRWFRHKTSKIPFQIVFWTIVAIHQFVAADFINGWRIMRNFVM